MNVNEKGVRGLIKVIDDLQEKSYLVFPAFDDHSPIDVIAVNPNDGKPIRIQVKYRTAHIKNGNERYNLSCDSVVNGKKKRIDLSLIDGWAVYLDNRKKVVYIKKEIMGSQRQITIDPDKDYGMLGEWFNPRIC